MRSLLLLTTAAIALTACSTVRKPAHRAPDTAAIKQPVATARAGVTRAAEVVNSTTDRATIAASLAKRLAEQGTVAKAPAALQLAQDVEQIRADLLRVQVDLRSANGSLVEAEAKSADLDEALAAQTDLLNQAEAEKIRLEGKKLELQKERDRLLAAYRRLKIIVSAVAGLASFGALWAFIPLPWPYRFYVPAVAGLAVSGVAWILA